MTRLVSATPGSAPHPLARPARWRRLLAGLSSVALVGVGVSFGLTPSAQALPPACSGSLSPALLTTLTCSSVGVFTVTVPVGTTSVDTDAIGGGGGAGYPAQPYTGGNAAEITGSLALPTGTVYLYVIVGSGGQGGNHDFAYGGGGSGVFALDTNHALIAKLVIAGAGAGGGYDGNGGDSAAAGTSNNLAAATGGSAGVGATGGAGGLALGSSGTQSPASRARTTTRLH